MRCDLTEASRFCIKAMEEALARNGKPEVFNIDQGGAARGFACVSTWNSSGGSQFTSLPSTGLLLEHSIAISMDGRGAWRDDVFVERLWRSVNYEEVYPWAWRWCTDLSVGQQGA